MMTLDLAAAAALPMSHEADLRAELEDQVEAIGTQTAWAKKHGISLPYLNDVLQGRRRISAEFARSLGYELMTVYVRMSPLSDEDAWLRPVPAVEDGEDL